jgi:hypothetical protein
MLGGLPDESNWKLALYPVDPRTGERHRAVPALEDPAAVEAFFAREVR